MDTACRWPGSRPARYAAVRGRADRAGLVAASAGLSGRLGPQLGCRRGRRGTGGLDDSRTLAPDWPVARRARGGRRGAGLGGAVLAVVVAAGAVVGRWLLAPAPMPATRRTEPGAVGSASRRSSRSLLLLRCRWSGRRRSAGRVFDAFYRSGPLAFGGGHVVLPLLHSTVVDPGWVSTAVPRGTARHRPCPDRCSPSPRTSAPSQSQPNGAQAPPSRRSRSSCRRSCSCSGLPSGTAARLGQSGGYRHECGSRRHTLRSAVTPVGRARSPDRPTSCLPAARSSG
jgi:hypothetical protein